MVHVNCPKCGQRLHLPPVQKKQGVRCAACKHEFAVSPPTQLQPLPGDHAGANTGILTKTIHAVLGAVGIGKNKGRAALSRRDHAATMTIAEAEQIVDFLHALLQDESRRVYGKYPVSLLQGWGLFQIDMAQKLHIANAFLILAGRDDAEEQFAAIIEHFDPAMLILAPEFVEDQKLDELRQLSKTFPEDSHEFRRYKYNIAPCFYDNSTLTFKDKRVAASETPSSFGDFCRSVGAGDPIYWQKIYTRIGLEYASTSPRGNEPVFVNES